MLWAVEMQLCYCPQLSLMRTCIDHGWVVAQGCLRTADLELGIVRAGLVSCKLNANLGCQHVSQERGLGPPRMVGELLAEMRASHLNSGSY